MYCPSCGFEYTQKTNFCKRCGGNLSGAVESEAPKTSRTRIAGMFWAIAVFSVIGLLTVFNAFDHLVGRGLRGDELMVPFVMGLFFVGAVAGFLIWMLARMITAHQKQGRNVIVEKHFIREVPQAQLGSPTDPIQQTVTPSSVVEHTTRSMAGKYKESSARD